MKKYIAIDIGGTNIKYGLLNEDGEIEAHYKISTEAKKGPMIIMEKILNIVSELEKEFGSKEIEGVGISTAGQVDSENGEIIFASDAIPGYTGFKIKKYLEEKLPYKVEVENDVNCAMLGEMWRGSAKNVSDAIMITIGTGIGGAICINNKLYKGIDGLAGEWGYMRINDGTFQEEASTSSLIKKAKEKLGLKELDGETLFLIANNNYEIKKIIDEFYDTLAKGISNIIYVLGINKVILGGAIASRSEFKDEINKKISQYLISTFKNKDLITIAKLENTAGLVGAIFNFRTKYENKVEK